MEAFTGVTNPYALAEALVGRRIKWDHVAEPERLLANILGVSAERIFSLEESPVLAPHLELRDGEVCLREDLVPHLENLLEKEVFKGDEEAPLSSPGKPALKETVSALLGSEAGKPWNPPNVDWVDKGDFFEDVDEYNDPIQGYLGDCYFIAALASVSWARPYAILNMVRPSRWSEENPIHLVHFYRNGQKQEGIEVSELVPVRRGSHQWLYARSKDPGEIWPAIYEKAYASWRTNKTDRPEYPKISGGDPVRACAEILHGNRTYYWNSKLSATTIWQTIRANSLGGATFNPMVAWTYCHPPAHLDYRKARVVACHAYSILGWAYHNRQRYVVLRNPWGTHHAVLNTYPGPWYIRNRSWRSIPLNRDGVFAMEVSTFKDYFAGFGVTK